MLGFLPPMLHDSSLTAWQGGRPLVCIDFGSMGCMGLIPDPHHLVRVLVAALQRADAKGILLTGASLPYQAWSHCLPCWKSLSC